ncbi:hypothetical protein B0O99DRAFT_173174 [Bisporella sp. PMI_857]|nr:hypothetical protein B0O99DRAFT_173174 [Bisporella sp. PMI_857]
MGWSLHLFWCLRIHFYSLLDVVSFLIRSATNIWRLYGLSRLGKQHRVLIVGAFLPRYLEFGLASHLSIIIVLSFAIIQNFRLHTRGSHYSLKGGLGSREV